MKNIKKLERQVRNLAIIEQFLIDVEEDRVQSYTLAKLQNYDRILDELISDFSIKKEPEYQALVEMKEKLHEIIQEELKMRRLVLDYEREVKNITKTLIRDSIRELQARVEIKQNLCIKCNKRPRHFGDHCKRCANELGTRPTGKIT